MSNAGSASRPGAASMTARIAIAIAFGSKSVRKSPAVWKRVSSSAIGVVAHELEVGLDVGAQHLWAGCLRFDARLHVGPRLLQHLPDDLGDQVVFAAKW
jgi:hypothetical protein